MANRWGNNGVRDFISLGSKNHCRWWLQPWKMLVLWKKSYPQPRQHIKKRDITLLTKIHLVKAMVFPVVMYESESWTIKKAECQIIDGFKLWFWRRLLRLPWTARSNQSIQKEINPEYSLEGLMLRPQYFGHLIGKANSLEKTWCWERLKAKEEGAAEDEMVRQHHWLNSHKSEQTLGDSGGQRSLACYSPWVCKESDMA